MAQSFSDLTTRFLGGARDLSIRGTAALRAWLSPEENPFLQKALRIEARRHKPLLSALTVALLCVIAYFVIWKLWLYLQFQIEAGKSGSWSLRSLQNTQDWLLAVFGHHPVGWFAIATAWVGVCSAFFAARARAGFLLRQELLKNTLTQLQQLPIAEERWVWLMAAHPLALGVLLGALGLPVYLLAVFTGLWQWLDVAGLFLIFIFLSHAAPSWTPALWQQSAKGKPQKLILAQLREWNKQGQTIVQSGDAAGALEHARHMQRALGGLDAEVSSEEKPAEKKSGVFGLGVNFGGRGNWWWGVVGINLFVQAGAGLGLGSWNSVTDSWPLDIRVLLPGIIVTWPLVAAKLLFAPLPFFAFHFPPALLLVPLWLAFSNQSFLSLAANVSAAETFWTPPRLRLRQNLAWLLATLILCFVFGYLWLILIEGGELARLIYGAPPLPSWALAAGWTLLCVAGAFLGGVQMEAPFKRAGAGLISAPNAWREAVFVLKRMAAFCLGIYFLFCWLGAQSGGNAVWLSRLPITLATFFAFALADFGSAAFGATLPSAARLWWGRLRGAWFHGLGIIALLFIARGAWMSKPFSFDDAPFVLLSPFVTLFSLLRVGASASISSQPLVWGALAFQICVGAICWLAARRAVFGRIIEAAPQAGSTPDVMQEGARQIWPPFSWLGKTVSVVLEIPVRWLESFVGAVNGWNDALLRWSRNYGNAVLTYELRRRLRKENWAWQWLVIFAAQVILFLSIAKPWQLISTGAPPGAYGFNSSNSFADWGATVTVIVLLLMALIGFVSCLSIARCFDADRANGTLVFLFLTPQTDREILRGKWLSGMIYTLGLLATGVLWLLCGVFVAVVLGFFPATGILALCALCALISGLFYVSMISLYFAVRSTKPMQAQGHALLDFLITEGIFAALLIYALIRWSDDLPKIPDEIFAAILLLIFAFTHAIFAFVMWRLTLHAFAKRRYGDIEAGGKGAN
jgi:hypothetical protein